MNKIARQALILCCFVVVNIGMSSAQTVGLNVDIPFNFNVAEKVLPAGHYLILAPIGETLRILGPGGAAALAITNRVSGRRFHGPGAVVFNCYGHRCFLSQFWTEATEAGQELLKCRIEKELATEREQLAVITLKAMPYQQ